MVSPSREPIRRLEYLVDDIVIDIALVLPVPSAVLVFLGRIDDPDRESLSKCYRSRQEDLGLERRYDPIKDRVDVFSTSRDVPSLIDE